MAIIIDLNTRNMSTKLRRKVLTANLTEERRKSDLYGIYTFFIRIHITCKKFSDDFNFGRFLIRTKPLSEKSVRIIYSTANLLREL